MDGAVRGKPGPAGISGLLHNREGISSLFFSEFIGARDSNEVKLLGIRKALSIWVDLDMRNLLLR